MSKKVIYRSNPNKQKQHKKIIEVSFYDSKGNYSCKLNKFYLS